MTASTEDRAGDARAIRERQPTPTMPIAFGPVRSRRLGWSLGINNVPPKTCSYSCVYCQVGATDHARLERLCFFPPDEVVAAVRRRVVECTASGQPVDIVTFVPDGEPTLDVNLGAAIRGVAGLGLRVAVLTNGSLLWREDVRRDLAGADWVSVKVDTVDEPTWHRLNRPIGTLRMETVLEGMQRFAADYRGELVTETMLIAGLNDAEATVGGTASFVRSLQPARAYVAIPTRPPAEAWVRAPPSRLVLRAAEVFRRAGLATSLLIDDVEAGFAVAPDPAAGLLGIVAVHPMSESDARDYLARAGADWSVAERLIASGRVVSVRHGERTFLRARR
jgi:wyosine [tRNA(Phe)-imidazoG37] synthetase (radical SAM superfamily)